MRFEFDWDPTKAESNRRKHGVTFEAAMGVFSGPLALSLLDNESGQGEERWVTRAMGYHRPKSRQQFTAGCAYLYRAVRGACGHSHYFGSPPNPPRGPSVPGRVTG